ncbi:hypothetical protein LCGC14_0248740 [marine sediment metagenome]|uniref:Uncharacterized protein n=1 Tax=marine sediment metagenome TaxID=412755 RepID=A0A0F9ULK4_9ZZZZ
MQQDQLKKDRLEKRITHIIGLMGEDPTDGALRERLRVMSRQRRHVLEKRYLRLSRLFELLKILLPTEEKSKQSNRYMEVLIER